MSPQVSSGLIALGLYHRNGSRRPRRPGRARSTVTEASRTPVRTRAQNTQACTNPLARAQTQTHAQGTRSTGAGLAAAALQGLGEAVDLGLDPAEARDAVLDSPPDFFLWILQEAVEMLL